MCQQYIYKLQTTYAQCKSQISYLDHSTSSNLVIVWSTLVLLSQLKSACRLSSPLYRDCRDQGVPAFKNFLQSWLFFWFRIMSTWEKGVSTVKNLQLLRQCQHRDVDNSTSQHLYEFRRMSGNSDWRTDANKCIIDQLDRSNLIHPVCRRSYSVDKNLDQFWQHLCRNWALSALINSKITLKSYLSWAMAILHDIFSFKTIHFIGRGL